MAKKMILDLDTGVDDTLALSYTLGSCFSAQNSFSPWTHLCKSLPVTHSFKQALVHDLSLGRNTILGP